RVDRHFGEGTYTLRLLFKDEQRKIVGLMLDAVHDGVETSFRRIYESTVPILRNLAASGTPPPPALRAAAEFYLNEQIRRALERSPPDLGEILGRLRELDRANLAVDAASVGYEWARAAERLIDSYAERSGGGDELRGLRSLIEIAHENSVEVDLSLVEDRYYEIARAGPAPAGGSPGGTPPRPAGDDAEFREIGERLRIRVA
ncbi:MAG: hypothetical protein ACRECR_02375, partial [Thermoplasmata archaeon]